MIEIEKPTLTMEEMSEDGSYGKFVLEPLERGYGTTLGNSLRRVLLSSLEGTAVTFIKIDGVEHEFSTIPGVKEDVTQVVLNVKGIIARLFSEEPKVLEVFADGPCVITAGDIKVDSEVEIVNKDHVIATLNEDAKNFHMELVLEKGRGYVSADRNKERSKSRVLGQLAVDSIFTPVVKVNYTVENTRVGKITDYDKLSLKVWTNGVISAAVALSMAGAVLVEHLNLFVNKDDLEKFVKLKERQFAEKIVDSNSTVSTIEDLDLSPRAANGLKRADILTLKQLLDATEDDLEHIRNFGKVSIEEVKKKLRDNGLSLKKTVDVG